MSLGFDFHDLQDALDQIEGKTPKRLEQADTLLRDGLEKLGSNPDFCRQVADALGLGLGAQIEALERRVAQLESSGDGTVPPS
ncbi:MAG: hypothetical protein AAF560_17080 [Acidobacteriota bacterium]